MGENERRFVSPFSFFLFFLLLSLSFSKFSSQKERNVLITHILLLGLKQGRLFSSLSYSYSLSHFFLSFSPPPSCLSLLSANIALPSCLSPSQLMTRFSEGGRERACFRGRKNLREKERKRREKEKEEKRKKKKRRERKKTRNDDHDHLLELMVMN